MTSVTAAPKMPQKHHYLLWEKGAPHSNGNEADSAYVDVFLPAKKMATGRAVIVCPGGGYGHLAMNHEGYDWAPFFVNQGIACIVLHYRMPYGNSAIPLEDAEEALRLVHRNAAEWNIDTRDIGIMGSSAGGHLASTVATHTKEALRPAFQILFYPVITMDLSFTHKGSRENLLGKSPAKHDVNRFSNDLQVTGSTPRAFIALSDDDHTVSPQNSISYYFELYRHDVPAVIHVYPAGGHGWGYRSSFLYHCEMELELRAWLRSF